MSSTEHPWGSDPVQRLLPGLDAAALIDEPDALRWAHGPLSRMGELAELAALGSVSAVLSLAPQAIVSAWNIDWNIRDPRADAAGLDLRLPLATALPFFRRGATLYVDHVEDAFAQLAPARASIERAMGLPRGRCTLEFLASIGGTGAGMHFDPDYAFNVQLFGRKRWQIAPNRNVDHPLAGATVGDVPQAVRRYAHDARFPERMPEDAQTFVTEPGSVVWVPRGTWHTTEVLSEGESLSLCFALKAPTMAQHFSAQLQRHLRRDPQWRVPSFGSAGSRRQRRDYVAQLDSCLARLLEHEDAALSERIAHDLPAGWTAWTLEVSPQARAELREAEDGLTLHVRTPSEHTQLRLAGEAASLAPVARWLSERREPFVAAEAAAVSEWAAQRSAEPVPFVVDDVMTLLGACLDAGLLQRRARLPTDR